MTPRPSPNDGNPERSASPPAPLAPAPESRRSAWRHLGRALLVIVLLEIGLFLLIVPWTNVWRDNGLAARMVWPASGSGTWLWPWLAPSLRTSVAALLASSFFRGAVSGLGLVNLWLGTGELRWSEKS